MRENPNASPNALRTVTLIIEFELVVEMEGILGFLENSTGRYFPQTIQAFANIDAVETVKMLQKVARIMETYNISWERLRSDFADAREFQIVSSSELHGEELDNMAEEIEEATENLFFRLHATEDVYGIMESYVEKHRSEILSMLNEISS